MSKLSNLQKLKSNRNTFLRKGKTERKSQECFLSLSYMSHLQQIWIEAAILLHQRKSRRRLIEARMIVLLVCEGFDATGFGLIMYDNRRLRALGLPR
jgi:hypothetical protein